MIPYILAAVGGYLIAQSQKKDVPQMADGGKIESPNNILKKIYKKQIDWQKENSQGGYFPKWEKGSSLLEYKNGYAIKQLGDSDMFGDWYIYYSKKGNTYIGKYNGIRGVILKESKLKKDDFDGTYPVSYKWNGKDVDLSGTKLADGGMMADGGGYFEYNEQYGKFYGINFIDGDTGKALDSRWFQSIEERDEFINKNGLIEYDYDSEEYAKGGKIAEDSGLSLQTGSQGITYVSGQPNPYFFGEDNQFSEGGGRYGGWWKSKNNYSIKKFEELVEKMVPTDDVIFDSESGSFYAEGRSSARMRKFYRDLIDSATMDYPSEFPLKSDTEYFNWESKRFRKAKNDIKEGRDKEAIDGFYFQMFSNYGEKSIKNELKKLFKKIDSAEMGDFSRQMVADVFKNVDKYNTEVHDTEPENNIIFFAQEKLKKRGYPRRYYVNLKDNVREYFYDEEANYAKGGKVDDEAAMMLYNFIDEKMVEGDEEAEKLISEKGYGLLGEKDLMIEFVQERFYGGDEEAEELLKKVGYYAKGGKVKSKKWIQEALTGDEGSLRRTAKRKGLLRGDENLSMTDLKKLQKMGGKTGKRAHLAETLRKFDDGGMIDKKIESLEIALNNPNLSPKTKRQIKMKLNEMKAFKEGRYSDESKYGKFEDGGMMANDDLRKAIYDMDEDEYVNFCAEYELDSDDSNEVENFVYDAKMSEAKKMIEDIKGGKYK